jgi:hypothetical protein
VYGRCQIFIHCGRIFDRRKKHVLHLDRTHSDRRSKICTSLQTKKIIHKMTMKHDNNGWNAEEEEAYNKAVI